MRRILPPRLLRAPRRRRLRRRGLRRGLLNGLLSGLLNGLLFPGLRGPRGPKRLNELQHGLLRRWRRPELLGGFGELRHRGLRHRGLRHRGLPGALLPRGPELLHELQQRLLQRRRPEQRLLR